MTTTEIPNDLVREFHRTYSLPIAPYGATPTVDFDRVGMRLALIGEEVAELFTAVLGETAGFLIQQAVETALAHDNHERDVVGAADALGDIAYVTYGMALEAGIPLDGVLLEIHRANLSKLGADGKPILRADGKVLKGPDYTPPNVAAVLGLARDDAAA